MIDCIVDGLLDTLKLLPYLFITFVLLEYIEHKLSKKNQKVLEKNKKVGPFFGGILGALPQCGFSTMGANLYANKVITMGTLIAIFLSTSDEMLPIMLGENVNILFILKVIGFKVLVGIIIGFIVDLIYRKKNNNVNEEIGHMCNDEHCHCDHNNIFIAGLVHAIKIALFILVANLFINLIIYYVGEDKISNILMHNNILTYFGASLIGLIPNCASSVIMTELYLNNLISIGNLIAGLLTGSGLGILLLFKSNKNIKENISILSIIYIVGVVFGIIVDIVL